MSRKENELASNPGRPHCELCGDKTHSSKRYYALISQELKVQVHHIIPISPLPQSRAKQVTTFDPNHLVGCRALAWEHSPEI